MSKKMKKVYRITVEGCDDSTNIEYELTNEQADLIKAIADKINETSKYTCMPTMDIEEKRTDDVRYNTMM